MAVLDSQDGCEVVVTCGPNGSHSRASLHYVGSAVDIVPLGISVATARRLVGDTYDIVDEGTHWHIEWQPKVPMNHYHFKKDA
jgi:hypothetical protein